MADDAKVELPESVERLMPLCSIPHPEWCPACSLRRAVAAALLREKAEGVYLALRVSEQDARDNAYLWNAEANALEKP